MLIILRLRKNDNDASPQQKRRRRKKRRMTRRGDDVTVHIVLHYSMFIKWNSTTQRVLFIFSTSSTHYLFLSPHISKSSKIVNSNNDTKKVTRHSCWSSDNYTAYKVSLSKNFIKFINEHVIKGRKQKSI